MNRDQAEAAGFSVDDTVYPWFAYKGPRFSPTASCEIDTPAVHLSAALMASDFEVGEKVTYVPFAGAKGKPGIVKEIREDVSLAIWVVYSCGGQWDRYQDYTSAKTYTRDLVKGWV